MPPVTDSVDSAALRTLFERAEEIAARSDAETGAGTALQVAVARNGALEGFRSFGRARFLGGPERPVTDATLFSIFSVTKALFASAVWVLLQERKLALADRVVDHFPEFGAHGKEAILVEHLLTHSAGIPTAPFAALDWPDPERRRQRFEAWRLDWKPGTRFVYHGTSSFWVLAELVARVSGVDHRDFLRTRVLEPLGLRNCFLGLPDEENARVADVVAVGDAANEAERAASPVDAPSLDDESVRSANHPESRAVGSPGGGAIATAADVALFYQGLLADAAERSGAPGIWRSEVLRDAWRVRNPDFVDPMTKQPALRGLGVVTAGPSGRIWRGFAEACSPESFGHMGAGGQISWADPRTGLSFAFCTSGAERDPARQGAEGLGLSSLAAACARERVP